MFSPEVVKTEVIKEERDEIKPDVTPEKTSPAPKKMSMEKGKVKEDKVPAEIVDESDDESTIRRGKDLHRKVETVREELEAEMRSQLKRQAEAHADHVRDQVRN